MNGNDPILPEDLSDEAVAQIVEILYSLARAIENRYCAQIIRHYQDNRPSQPDLWD